MSIMEDDLKRTAANERELIASGNILLFYAFDVGDEIDFDAIKRKRLLSLHTPTLSPYFKNYHIPMSFSMPLVLSQKERADCILNKLHPFGVISFCYKIPFEDSFDGLKQKIVDIKEAYDLKSESDARDVFGAIISAIKKPRFFNLKNDYFAVHVNPFKGKIEPQEFKELYGNKIASLLRLETRELSEYQEEDILKDTTGYYGQDFMIIDSEASFVYDDEYFEAMEFFESANVQQLELQYFDRLLDDQLTYFYIKDPYKLPWVGYIPLIGSHFELPISRLVRLKVDISVITERLENSIKILGEAYYSKLYAMLVAKLALKEWKDSINKKFNIIWDLYTVQQDKLRTIHSEVLEVVIIILIALELLL